LWCRPSPLAWECEMSRDAMREWELLDPVGLYKLESSLPIA
jgi:hypothetical protein